jgi:M6 family metalloprotease-like protein
MLMRNNILILLLLLVSLTAVADDGIRLRSCRRGVTLPTTTFSRHAQETPHQPGGDFYHGNRRQLVVLAAFPDRGFQDDKATTLAKWDKIFNAEDFHEGSFVGSVHDYFYAQSYGKFNLTFDFVYVNLPDSAKKYRSTYSHDEYSQYMVDDIVDTLMTRTIDWSQYDWNGNGYVNQILIVYAGKGMNADGGSNSIWPHQWWLSKHLKNPISQREGYRGYRTVTTGDKQFIIDCYCCAQEMVNTNTVKTSFGTICHEYSHCFGFPDFYYDGGTQTVGDWDLMDFGNYGKAGYCPCGYSAHERWLMGWLDPIELTTDKTVSEVPILCDQPQAYIIHNEAHRNEYYIIENRQKKGWDASLPGNGLMVFHVDFDASLWTSTKEAPNSKDKKRYRIITANNNKTLTYASMEGWPYPYQSNDSLTNTSTPAAELNNANTDGKKLMNKSLFDMKVENDLASFRFATASTTDIEELRAGQPYKILYDLGPIYIIRYANGEIKKVMKH